MKKQIILGASLVAGSAAIRATVTLPPMGFSTGASSTADIDEETFVDAANAMSSNGLLAAGYNRINLDDGWSYPFRTDNGSLTWDPIRFPHGLPWLTESLKEQGFTPGIFADAGTVSCAGYPGSLGYEEQDLESFEDWGFEFLTLDGYSLPNQTESEYFTVFYNWSVLVKDSAQELVFSQSSPAYFTGEADLTEFYELMTKAVKFGQLARNSPRIDNDGISPAWDSIMSNYRQQVLLSRYQGYDLFNDPGYLITDNPTLTLDEKRSQFALWCTLSAPLFLNVNVTALTEDELAIVTNDLLIAVNQDTLEEGGAIEEQATLVSWDDTWDVLIKTLAGYDQLVTVLNRGSTTASLTIPWERTGIFGSEVSTINVTDLWTGDVTEVAYSGEGITASDVPPHGTAVFRITSPEVGIFTTYPTGLILNAATLHCLTDNGGSANVSNNYNNTVTWAACDGSDGQVWVGTDYVGTYVKSLLSYDQGCLAIGENDEVVINGQSCDSTLWEYRESGNLILSQTGDCVAVTEPTDGNGTATVASCGTSEAILSLPVGFTVESP